MHIKRKLHTLPMIVMILAANPVIAADGPPSQSDLEVNLGAGTIYAPAFLGSKDYQLLAVPNVRIRYKDQLFASVQEGIGYNAINKNGWRIGPVAKYSFERSEDGKNPFRIAGPITTALHGLGNVDGTLELGGFTEYTYHEWRAKMELRQGISGHEGLISNLGVGYSKDIHSTFYTNGPPLIVSVSPRATIVSSKFNQAYFGINAEQSANSGLAQYNAGGGLLSYGIGAAAILPITRNITGTLIAGYDRLTGDAADSPLIKQRGSQNQASMGLFLSYAFRH